MSFTTGPYGIETSGSDRDGRPALGGIVSAVVAVAAVSLAFTLVKRLCARIEPDPAPAETTRQQQTPPRPAPAVPEQARPETPQTAPVAVPVSDIDRRPPKVRSLLLRLDRAEADGNVEMAVATIELIRAQPGQPAADIDDKLARRLGELNVRWLFELKNAQWVADVKVKSGDSATRIAREHASTLASLRRLNGLTDIERLRAGASLKVMKNPRFNLIVHSRARTADLQLNGKFFKRYDLASAATGLPGTFESSGNLRQLLAEKGVLLAPEDRAELEVLMPKGSTLTISDL